MIRTVVSIVGISAWNRFGRHRDCSTTLSSKQADASHRMGTTARAGALTSSCEEENDNANDEDGDDYDDHADAEENEVEM